MSPELACRFLTTGPPGKSWFFLRFSIFSLFKIEVLSVQYCMFQKYNIVIHNFNGYILLTLLWYITCNSLCCALYPCSLFIFKVIVCTSKSFTPCLPFLPSLSPSLSSLVTTSLFWVSVSFFLFCYILWCYIFLDSTCKVISYIFVIFWFISLRIISSKSIYVVTNGKVTFFYVWIVFHFDNQVIHRLALFSYMFTMSYLCILDA